MIKFSEENLADYGPNSLLINCYVLYHEMTNFLLLMSKRLLQMFVDMNGNKYF